MGSITVPIFIKFVDNDENDIINQVRSKLNDITTIIAPDVNVKIQAFYGTFKKGALKNPFGCNYSTEILFDYIKYEIYTEKFFEGNIPPNITTELIDTLQKNNEIETVCFDADGHNYFNALKNEDGKFYINNTVEIKYEFSSRDIIEGQLKGRGHFRFSELRLLHKTFTRTEIEELCNQMGNTIYEHIDFYSRKIGLRK